MLQRSRHRGSTAAAVLSRSPKLHARRRPTRRASSAPCGAGGAREHRGAAARLHHAPLFAVVTLDVGAAEGTGVARQRVRGCRPPASACRRSSTARRPHADQYVKLAYCAAMLEVVEHGWARHWRGSCACPAVGRYWPVPPAVGRRAQPHDRVPEQQLGRRHQREVRRTRWPLFVERWAARPCGGALPTRTFACGCDIVRTEVASATIARLGLVPAVRLAKAARPPRQAPPGPSHVCPQSSRCSGSARARASRPRARIAGPTPRRRSVHTLLDRAVVARDERKRPLAGSTGGESPHDRRLRGPVLFT